MVELTEDRVREIVKEEIVKTPLNIGKCNVTLDIDAKKVSQYLVEELRKRRDERI